MCPAVIFNVSFFRISVLSILVGISCSHERVGSIPTPTSDGLLRMVHALYVDRLKDAAQMFRTAVQA